MKKYLNQFLQVCLGYLVYFPTCNISVCLKFHRLILTDLKFDKVCLKLETFFSRVSSFFNNAPHNFIKFIKTGDQKSSLASH